MGVILPVGIGVVIGVVLISNIVSLLLRRARNATLGVLIGLLMGAVFGLWPYRAPVRPHVGDMIRGQLIETQAQIDAVDPGHWASASFSPSIAMVAGSLALIIVGVLASLAISRLGREDTAR
jgi:putative membrane protein